VVELFSALAVQFQEDSFGYPPLAQVLLMGLRCRCPFSLRMALLQDLSPYALHLLRPLPEGPPGGPAAFLTPVERDGMMIEEFARAVCSGIVSSSPLDSAPVLYFSFLSHLSARILAPAPGNAGTQIKDGALLRRIVATAPTSAAIHLLAVEPASELPSKADGVKVVAWMRDGIGKVGLSGVKRETLEAVGRSCGKDPACVARLRQDNSPLAAFLPAT